MKQIPDAADYITSKHSLLSVFEKQNATKSDNFHALRKDDADGPKSIMEVIKPSTGVAIKDQEGKVL